MAGGDSSSTEHIRYYDCTSDATNDTWVSANADGSYEEHVTINVTVSGTSTRVTQRILVSEPEHWTEEDGLAFARLLNVHTRTGWICAMIVKGPIIVTDPRIQRRTMAEFLPLLRRRASQRDLETIDAFFKVHTLHPPQEE